MIKIEFKVREDDNEKMKEIELTNDGATINEYIKKIT